MALKNHALDEKIVKAARAEFLEKGFRDASLHKIAQRAGTTTGAIYTRYKSKDDLFCSLVEDLMAEIAEHMLPLQDAYSNAQRSGDPAQILQAIRQEEQIYQQILFRHGESCVLLVCRSGGSSLEAFINQSMETKSVQTVEYLKSICKKDPELDMDGVALLISEQFQFFRQILEKGYSPKKAMACIKTVELYMEAGWKALFEAIL